MTIEPQREPTDHEALTLYDAAVDAVRDSDRFDAATFSQGKDYVKISIYLTPTHTTQEEG